MSESVSDGSLLRPRRDLAGRVWNPELLDMSASAERAGVGGEKPVRVEAMVGGCVQLVQFKRVCRVRGTGAGVELLEHVEHLREEDEVVRSWWELRLITSKWAAAGLLLLRWRQ